MTLPDYSEYLKQPGMLEYIEQEWLNNPAFHDIYSDVINAVIAEYKIKTVVEVGCGTGNVAARLVPCKYAGMDANEDCIELCKTKNPGVPFLQADIRSYKAKSDLVFTFGVLKHFGLHEWNEIFTRIASIGKYFVFDMPISNEVKDDGEEHHHVWGTMAWIQNQCMDNGIEILETKQMNVDEWCFICKQQQL